jgi:hypothetical protein
MLLNVQERLLLLGLQEIPRFGNIVTMGIVSDFFSRVQFTEKEITEWKIQIMLNEKTGMSKATWDPSVASTVEINITPGMAKIATEAMERVPEQPGLSIFLVPVYRAMKAMILPEAPKTATEKENDDGPPPEE